MINHTVMFEVLVAFSTITTSQYYKFSAKSASEVFIIAEHFAKLEHTHTYV